MLAKRLMPSKQLFLYRKNIIVKSYHSYPNPDEKPNIVQTKSQAVKQLDKSISSEFILDTKFKFEKIFPGTPISKGIHNLTAPETQSTILSNGLCVATQEMAGLMSSFAFIVKSGSSYETQNGVSENTGSTHFLELNAFRSTKNKSHKKIITEIEHLGGMVQCISTRETIIYCIDVLRSNTEKALSILADTVLNPLFPEVELDESRHIVELQQQELPAEIFSRDAVQIAAYHGYPLGNSHYCPIEKVSNVNAIMLHDFRKKFFFGENCIVSAVGVEHESFVKLVEEKFGTLQNNKISTIKRKPSQFTGGMVQQEKTLKEPFVKVAIAFEVGGWNDELLLPICVLQILLGGGSSFSAGGPGKGMYSRLYTKVLNSYHWAESVESFISLHDERGILGIDGACPPDYVVNLIKVIVEHLTILAYNEVSEQELSRAKNMLKSMLMMQLESRLILCEDIARQYATYGKREPSVAICEKIDLVTAKDLIKVAERMLEYPPAVGCVGHDLSKMPSYEDIDNYVKNYRATEVKKNAISSFV